ncbi:MAG: Ig-like domain repeat protein, partial [Thermoplasmata archaeon]|nr:Ig-like domain repeat protein [Thermoplasmata archaeon]
GDHTIQYYSTDNAGNIETTHSFELKIDTTPPSTTHSLSPSSPDGNNGWYVSNVVITLNAVDSDSGVNSTYYSIDGGAYIKYTNPFTVSNDGDHTIQYYSTDNAGNIETTHSFELKIDTTPPSTTHSLSPSSPDGNNGWYVSNVVITLNAVDSDSGVNSTYYSIDGGAYIKYTNPFTVSNDGDHTIQYYSTDNAGNIETTHSFELKIDKTPPSTVITVHPPSVINYNNVTFGWNGSDNLSPNQNLTFSYKLGGYDTSWSGWSAIKTKVYPNLQDGNYTFMVRAKDSAGNIDPTPANYSFSIDTSPPTISDVKAQPSSQNIGGNVNISCNVEDEFGVQNVFINITYPDGSYDNISISQNKTDDMYYYNNSYNMMGLYNFFIYAIDTTNNGKKSVSKQFQIADLMPPNVEISSPSKGSIVRGNVNIRWNATDNHDSKQEIKVTIKYSIDNGLTWHNIASNIGNSGSYTWNTSEFQDSQNYMIKISAEDTSGNTGSDISDKFTVDNTPPSLEITKPLEGQIYIFDRAIFPTFGHKAIIIGKITITASVSDSISGVDKVEFYIDGVKKAEDNKAPYSMEWKEWAVGSYTIKVKAYDKAGNEIEKIVDARAFIL